MFALDRIVEPGAIRRETIDVGLGEEQLVGIQRLQVALEDLRRHRIVQRQRPIVELTVAEQAVHQLRGVSFLDRRRQRDAAIGGMRRRASGHRRGGRGITRDCCHRIER